MMKTKTITIEVKVTEQEFMEGLLNMKYSGASEKYLMLCIGIFALGEQWHFDKFNYYLDLLGQGAKK